MSRPFFTESALQRLLDFLRREHPVKTIDCVAASLALTRCRVSRAAVAKWFSRSSAPSFSAFCALVVAYGPRLLASVIGPGFSWLDEAACTESRKKLDGQIEQMKRDLGLT